MSSSVVLFLCIQEDSTNDPLVFSSLSAVFDYLKDCNNYYYRVYKIDLSQNKVCYVDDIFNYSD